ncbi:hypothetical protein EB093_00235 [bacterium]|nr:hypothetical protein [bacterium]
MVKKFNYILGIIGLLATHLTASDIPFRTQFYSVILSSDFVTTPNNKQSSINYFILPSIATFSITTYDLNFTPTPGAIEAIRIHDRYDGWILKHRRDLTSDELSRSNSQSGSLAVYGFTRMDANSLKIKNKLSIEYSYITNHRSAVITVETDDTHWKHLEPKIKQFVRLFMFI